jgi:hypothetical protein
MPTPTYTALATVTLGSAASSVTFSSIPATYRDLILVFAGPVSSNDTLGLRFNSDTGNNYNSVSMNGNGSSATSSSWTSVSSGYFGALGTGQNNAIIQVMDYSATDKHKTFVSRSNSQDNQLRAHATRWANTAAITSVIFTSFGGVNYQTGSTFSLYGVIA